MASNTNRLVRAGLLLAATVAIQSLRTGQAVTGPVINAILFCAPSFTGTAWAMAIGGLTPVTALLTGTLNPGLAASVPFIAAGNVVLTAVFVSLRPRIGWPSVLVAAVVKYGIIAGGITLFLSIGPPLSLALGIRQLITALLGGALAWAVIKILEAYGPRHGRSRYPGPTGGGGAHAD